MTNPLHDAIASAWTAAAAKAEQFSGVAIPTVQQAYVVQDDQDAARDGIPRV